MPTRNNRRPSGKQFGEFRLFFSYVSPTTNVEDTEPCMCLGRAGIKRSAWVIPLSAAWMYADSETGEPTEYLIGKAVQIAHHLQLGVTRDTIFKISSAIVDFLPDLIKMPPWAGLELADIERAAERHQLKVALNGEELLDTTK